MAGLPGSTLEKARPDAELTRLKEPLLGAPGGTAGALVQRQKQPLAEHAGKVGTARNAPRLQPVIPSEGWEARLPGPSGTLGLGSGPKLITPCGPEAPRGARQVRPRGAVPAVCRPVSVQASASNSRGRPTLFLWCLWLSMAGVSCAWVHSLRGCPAPRCFRLFPAVSPQHVCALQSS